MGSDIIPGAVFPNYELSDHRGTHHTLSELQEPIRWQPKRCRRFSLSVAELAALVGRTRQTASKTPDADSLQPVLQPFERVARVRAVLRQSDFRKWLHLADDELDGQTPFEVIRKGKIEVVADLVEDMLTGSPS